jgi:hypothetical protein
MTALRPSVEDLPKLLPLSLPKFQYTPLQPRQIRLLRLHGNEKSPKDITASISVVSLDDNPTYRAISYCWGDPTPTHQISLSTHPFGVTETVKQFFLRAIELGYAETSIWIDAICIDQTNIEERSQQVKLMGDVYSKAVEVLIWFGEASDDSHHAIQLLNSPQIRQINNKKASSSQVLELLGKDPLTRPDSPAWRAMEVFLYRPWFSRLWVVQEGVLSRRAILICGPDTASWSNFDIFLHRCLKWQAGWCASIVTGSSSAQVPAPGWDTAVAIQSRRAKLVKHKGFGKMTSGSMTSLLIATSSLLATDPRDKIYGILNLAEDKDRLYGEPALVEPDYSIAAAELYRRATVELMWVNKSLALLGLAGVGWRTVTPDLPSWCPDYACYNAAHYETSRQLGHFLEWSSATNRSRSYAFEKYSKNIDLGELYLTGAKVDVVESIGRVWEADFDFDAALNWLWDSELQFVGLMGKAKTDFLQTLVGIQYDTIPSVSRFEAFKSFLAKKDEEAEDEDKIAPGVHEFLNSITCCHNRRVCATEGGKLGLVPELSQIGDLLYQIDNLEELLLLRPKTTDGTSEISSSKFQLVGTCFNHGLEHEANMARFGGGQAQAITLT